MSPYVKYNSAYKQSFLKYEFWNPGALLQDPVYGEINFLFEFN